MTNPKWEIGPVKLVCGWDAVIHQFCEKRQQYIGGVLDGNGSWFAREWNAAGWYSLGIGVGDGFNLAPPPKKKVRVQRWAVIYSDGSACFAFDKDEAIKEAKKNGFALLEIDREVEEGKGL